MNGKKITFGVLAALIAAKMRQGSKYREVENKYAPVDDQDILNDEYIAKITGIPLDDWQKQIVNPFNDPKVMGILTRNMFINGNTDFYNPDMVFVAENLGQLYRKDMCPIRAYAQQINQSGVRLLTNQELDIKSWLRSHPDQVDQESYEQIPNSFLFMIKLNDPTMLLDLETSCLIADTIGPQLYHDVYYNLTM